MRVQILLAQIYLVFYSLSLDLRLLTCHFPLTFVDRLEFIFKKYLAIIKHRFLDIPLTSSSSKISFGKRDYFYGSELGMGVFQAMIISINKHVTPLLEGIKNPVIVDVGAHLGFFSLPLAFLLSDPTIYALEPVSYAFNLLKKNTDNLKSIKAFRLGLLDKAGRRTIYFNPKLLMYSSIFSERFTWDEHPYKETIHLNTLDSFCKDNNIQSINLLKIDVEGAEERVLKGGHKTLSKTKYLFLECSLDRVDNSTFSSLISCLIGKDYNFQLIKIMSTIADKNGRLLTANMLFENLLFRAKK